MPIGSTKEVCKKAFFKLSKIWHPDKHQTKSKEDLERATAKYKQIVAAWDSLQHSDEEASVEALTQGNKGQKYN